MPDTYIPRSLEPVLRQAERDFPAVVLVGPRQSGKTTLLRHVHGAERRMISLETPDVRAAAAHDPRGFLDLYPPPVIFDEIQYAPELLPYIKERVDAARDLPGQFVLTGSQNLLLMQQVTESLAGRAVVLKLLPLTAREAARDPARPLPWEVGGGNAAGQGSRADLSGRSVRRDPASTSGSSAEVWLKALRGYFPELVKTAERDHRLWLASYVQTYLERDVRNLRNVGDLTLFQTFLRALAARSATLLNLTDLARDVGIAVNTAKDWLSVLEATFQVFLLRPYYANLGKRLIKAPKVYFVDTGLLCYLVGLREVEYIAAGPMAGPIFENLVVAEIYKTLLNRGEEPAMSFWRTAAGHEVDLIIERALRLVPIEIKASATPRVEMAAGIARFKELLGDRVDAGFVVHTGEVVLPLGGGTVAVPFREV